MFGPQEEVGNIEVRPMLPRLFATNPIMARVAILTIWAMMLCGSAPARGDLVSYSLSGVITYVHEGYDYGFFAEGDEFTGTLTYDTQTDGGMHSWHMHYLHIPPYDPSVGLDLVFDYGVSRTDDGQPFGIDMMHDVPGLGDALGTSALDPPESELPTLHLSLRDSSGTAFSEPGLPTSLSLEDFDQRSVFRLGMILIPDGRPVFDTVILGSVESLQLVLSAEVDIEPWSDHNAIYPFSRRVFPVALLGSDDFDVADVDVTTLAFGPNGAPPAFDLTNPFVYWLSHWDVNGDGNKDLLSHHQTEETGIAMGDGQACLTGETLDGAPFEGCDFINTEPPCGNGYAAALVVPPVMWIGGRMRRRRR